MSAILTNDQVKKEVDFIHKYVAANNAADGSDEDPNANVTVKNIATMSHERPKPSTRQVNRHLRYDQIKKDWSARVANEYIRQIERHEIYIHDETSLFPYCVSISLYPYLLNGVTMVGGESEAPQHLHSFCGSFKNLLFQVANQFAGAVATGEFFVVFDHFARLTYGKDYLKKHEKLLSNHFQDLIYTMNEPAGARGCQSIFWNISIFDKYYLKSIFEHMIFPDGSKVDFESTMKLQEYFMTWFNNERKRKVLTFPVVTAASLIDEETNKPKDMAFAKFLAKELEEGNSFFMYSSPTPDSLSSCCFNGDETIKVINNETNQEEIMEIQTFVEYEFKKDKYSILSLNPNTLKLENSKIKNILKKPFNGNMINIKVNGNSITVTPDHPLLVKHIETNKISKITAQEYYENYQEYLIPIIE